MDLIKVKRVNINAAVQADVFGNGTFAAGTVTATTSKTVTIKPFDGSADLVLARSVQLFQAKAPKTAKVPKSAKMPKGKKARKARKQQLDEDGEPIEEEGTRLTFRKLGEYKKGNGITSSGRDTFDNNDKVSRELAPFAGDMDALYRHVSGKIGEPAAALKRRYGHLKPGMCRMNLGNRLRGFYADAAGAKKA